MKSMILAVLCALALASCQKPDCIYQQKIEVLDSLGRTVPYKYNYDTVYSHTAYYPESIMNSEDLKAIQDIYVHQSFGGDTIRVTFTGNMICNQ